MITLLEVSSALTRILGGVWQRKSVIVILVPWNPASVTTHLSFVHLVSRVQSIEVMRSFMSVRALQVGPYCAKAVRTQR